MYFAFDNSKAAKRGKSGENEKRRRAFGPGQLPDSNTRAARTPQLTPAKPIGSIRLGFVEWLVPDRNADKSG